MFALAHGRNRNWRMPVVRRRHVDGVQVRLLLQQLAEIHVSGAASVSLRLVETTVVSLNESLRRLAPADAQAGRKALCELNRAGGIPVFPPILETRPQQAPCLVQHGVRTVFGVLLAALIDIADRDYLNFGEL